MEEEESQKIPYEEQNGSSKPSYSDFNEACLIELGSQLKTNLEKQLFTHCINKELQILELYKASSLQPDDVLDKKRLKIQEIQECVQLETSQHSIE